jgi:WD40 repeat protein
MTLALADSFFVTGGTLERNAPSYVPRRADDELYEALSEGRFCFVLTPRQMGKSSLMVRTAARLREHGDTAVILDLTEIGRNLTVDQWYRGLLGSIGESLGLEEPVAQYWRSSSDLGPHQRWTKALREVVVPRCRGRVVLFVDEIDSVRSLPFSTDEFFAGIRELYNRRGESDESSRLTFCLLGVASPSDLIRDIRTTPFNIGHRIELRDFTEADAEPLLDGLGSDRDAARTVLRRVLYWTGGHPYLTQRLCKAVAGESSDASEVDKLANELFLLPRARERDDNLLFVRDRVLRADTDVSALLFLYRRIREREHVVDDDTNPLVTVLKLAGIIRIESGELKVRNRIYEQVFNRDWVTSNLPGAEVRRQALAFRRGILRTAAVAIVVLSVVGLLALYALTQWRRAEGLVDVADLQRERAEREQGTNRRLLYVAHMSLAYRELDKGNLGRVAELVDEEFPDASKGDVRGWEYYYLWRLCHGEQARLQLDGPVRSCAFSPDGAHLATTGDDGVTRVWDVASREVRAELSGTESSLTLAYSRDGRMLAVGGVRGDVELWDVEKRAQIGTIAAHRGRIFALAFAPDGRSLVTAGSDGMVALWNTETRKSVWSVLGDREGLFGVEFSPDGRVVATGGEGGIVTLWDAATGREVLTTGDLELDSVTDLAFSPRGDALAASTAHGTLVIVTLAKPTEPRKYAITPAGLASVAFSPDGSRVAVGASDSAVHVVDAVSGRTEARYAGNKGPITHVAYSRSGDQFAAASSDGVVKVWSSTSLADTVRTLRGHSDVVYSVAFSADGRRLATASFDTTVGIWDVATGSRLVELAGHTENVMSVAFSPDGTRVVSGSRDRTARIWDVETGVVLTTLSGHNDSVFSVAFAPDGSRIATGSFDGFTRLWDAATGSELASLRGPGGSIETIAFTPDGRFLLCGGEDRVVEVWDLSTLQRVRKLEAAGDWVNVLALSRDGSLLATSGSFGDPTVRVWDTETWTTKHVLKGFFRLGGADEKIGMIGRANCLAFDKWGSTLAVGTGDSTVRFFDVLSGEELGSGTTKQLDRLCSIAFSPDGTLMATASDDGTVKLWRAAQPSDLSAR